MEAAEVDGEKKPSEQEEKGVDDVDNNSNLDGKEQVIAENFSGNAVIKKDQSDEHLLAVAGEDAESEKVKLQEEKVMKRKRSELQKIKQEKLVSDEQEHLLAVAEEDAESEKVKLQEKKVMKRKRSDAQEDLLAVGEEDAESEKVQLQETKVKKKKSSDVVGEPSSKATCPLRWCASYYTRLHHKYQKTKYNGSVLLDPEENHVILFDDGETTLDGRYLKEGECIYPELLLKFPCHKAEIGKQILVANEVNLKKRKRSEEEMSKKNQRPMSSPQAKLVGSSIGMFARVAALRKRMSPSVPTNVTAHFPSPNLPRVGADFTRHQPRKLKSMLWKDFIPIYELGKLVEGKCKHCNEVFPASKSSGTNHIRRHLRKCETRSSMHEMVAKMRASTPSPRVSLDNWKFSQNECRRDLANMIVHHGLPFSIVEYSGFKKFVKSLNPMFRMVSLNFALRPVLLDPRYKRSFIEFRLGQAFGHNAGEHLQKVDMIMKSLFEDYSSEMGDSIATNPSEEVQDGVQEFDDSLADWQAHLKVQKKQVPNELERYMAEELFPPSKDFDILGWWEVHGPKYPVLSCIARDVLAIQASTVASESSFSAGGRILTDHRSRLTSKMVEVLICLQDWLKAADPKPISKDVEEEECLMFYQVNECHEETAAHQAIGNPNANSENQMT